MLEEITPRRAREDSFTFSWLVSVKETWKVLVKRSRKITQLEPFWVFVGLLHSFPYSAAPRTMTQDQWQQWHVLPPAPCFAVHVACSASRFCPAAMSPAAFPQPQLHVVSVLIEEFSPLGFLVLRNFILTHAGSLTSPSSHVSKKHPEELEPTVITNYLASCLDSRFPWELCRQWTSTQLHWTLLWRNLKWVSLLVPWK